jgi:hypothetical protein
MPLRKLPDAQAHDVNYDLIIANNSPGSVKKVDIHKKKQESAVLESCLTCSNGRTESPELSSVIGQNQDKFRLP